MSTNKKPGAATPGSDPTCNASENTSVPKKSSAPHDPMLSGFPCAWDADTVADQSLSAIIDRIRSNELADATAEIRERYAITGGDKKAIENLKKRLPAVTLAGVFARRANAAWRESSSLVQIDLDGLSAENMDASRATLIATPWIACLWASPSGGGLKGAVRVPGLALPDPARYTVAWRAVTRWLESLGFINDPAAKDAARLAFLAHDPAAYFNPEATEFPLDDWAEPEPQSCLAKIETVRAPSKNAGDVIRRALAYVEAMPPSIEHQNGSGALMAVVRALRDGFDLTGAELWRVLDAWNASRASPAWSRAELQHALDSVEKVPPQHPRGWLRDSPAKQQASAPTVPVRDAALVSGGGAPVARLVLRSLAETDEKQPEWLWDGYLLRGAPAVLGGRQGSGKGLVVADIVARLTTGQSMPDGTENRRKINVLIITREDDPEMTLKPRLRLAGADLSRVYWSFGDILRTDNAREAARNMSTAAPCIERAITDHDIGLVVVDPLGAWIQDDGNSSAEIRGIIDPMIGIGMRTRCATLFVAHLRKNIVSGEHPMDAFAGSAQVTAAVRVAWLLTADEESSTLKLQVVKTNFKQGVPVCARFVRASGARSADDPPAVSWYFPEPPKTNGDVPPSDRELAILGVLVRRGAQPRRQLASALKIPDGTVRRCLDRLRARGLIDGKNRPTQDGHGVVSGSIQTGPDLHPDPPLGAGGCAQHPGPHPDAPTQHFDCTQAKGPKEPPQLGLPSPPTREGGSRTQAQDDLDAANAEMNSLGEVEQWEP